MELTPQTLHAVEFREARRGGYNTRDVDDFLERVAAGVGLLQDRLRDVVARAESAEARVVEMQRQLEETHRQLDDAHRQLEEARRRPPAPEASETDDTLRRTLVLAQRTADATIKEAKDEAARLLSEAREEATRIRSEIEAEARRGTEDARLAAEAELEELLSRRDGLRAEVETLTGHLDAQRDRLRAGVRELQSVLDSDAFQPVPPPALGEIEQPPAGGFDLPSRSPSAEPLPSRSPSAEPLPSRSPSAEPLPSRSPSAEPLPSRSPSAEPLPSRSPSAEPLPSRSRPAEPLPSRSRPAEPLPARTGPAASSLPASPGQAGEPDAAEGDGVPESVSPFLSGANVAALQEAPPPLRRRNPEHVPGPEQPAALTPGDAVAEPQPAAFSPFNGSTDAGSGGPVSPWPSELRTSVGGDDADGGAQPESPIPAPPNGTVEGIGIKPGSRPSEWGKKVFARDDEPDPTYPRFGQR